MNYKLIYQQLINKRLQERPEGYTEKHHIVMKSMGGSDSDDNLVALTGREHWIAHLLLFKIHRNRSTARACHMMSMRCEERENPRIKTSRMYEAVRIALAKIMKIKQTGKGNSQYGTMWICNIDLKQNRKIKKSDEIPVGWIKGSNKWNKLIKCNECNKDFMRIGSEKYCNILCKKEHKRKNPVTLKDKRDPLSIETRKRLSDAAKKRTTENPKSVGRGTIWINDGISVNRRINSDAQIPKGFKRGRF